MTIISAAVNELGSTFNLVPPLDFNGHAAFTIEEMGTLDLEEKDGKLVIRLALDIHNTDDRTRTQCNALKSVHFNNNLQPPVQVSMVSNTLIFTLWIEEEDVNLPAIDEAINTLHSLHQQARM